MALFVGCVGWFRVKRLRGVGIVGLNSALCYNENL